MRNITRASIALIGAVALTGATALSATAATGDSAATVAVAGGDLSIAVPATLTLNSTGPGVAATGTLGTVTVTDATASTAGWDTSITLTDFTSLVTDSPTIPATGFLYNASPAVVTGAGAGTVTATPNVAGGATAAVVQSATALGNNVATWTADVTLEIPANALAGDYTATLTHSAL